MRLTPRKLGQVVLALLTIFLVAILYRANNDPYNSVNEYGQPFNKPKVFYKLFNNDRGKKSSLHLGVLFTNPKSDNVIRRDFRVSNARKNIINKLTDVYISVKTTKKFHNTRLKILLSTWIEITINQTFIFTDSEDDELQRRLGHHIINVNCSSEHKRQDLCCKMSYEYDYFLNSKKRWFCHVDDDTYVNVPALVSFLQKYDPTEEWYLGRSSLPGSLEIPDIYNPEKSVTFKFATGGAGFCISRSLALKMIPYAGGGRLMSVANMISLPDDCTVGFIIEHLLKVPLTNTPQFHSHLESLSLIKSHELKNDLTFSYLCAKGKCNTVHLTNPMFSLNEDPTRLLSLHCYIHPSAQMCQRN